MPSVPAPRKAVLLLEKVSDEMVKGLASLGLEVRAGGDPGAPDVLLADPRLIAVPECPVEGVIALRAGALLAQIGDTVPDLHETVMTHAERGLFRAVLAHTQNHLGRTSKILGLDRNTCARKARAFGLMSEPARGRKPQPAKSKTPKAPPRRKAKVKKKS